MPARPGSAAEARRALLALPLPDPVRGDLELLVSELVNNSVRHAGPAAHESADLDHPVDLLVTQENGDLRVEVHDRGPGFSRPDEPVQREEGGLGLVIVNALASAWGVDVSGDGCTVWCTLPTNGAT